MSVLQLPNKTLVSLHSLTPGFHNNHQVVVSVFVAAVSLLFWSIIFIYIVNITTKEEEEKDIIKINHFKDKVIKEMSKSNKSKHGTGGGKKGKEKSGTKKLPVESIIDTGSNKSSLPTRPSSSMATTINPIDRSNNSSHNSPFIEVHHNSKKHNSSNYSKKSFVESTDDGNSSPSSDIITTQSTNGTIIVRSSAPLDPMDKPIEFLQMKYPNVTLSAKNTIATRSKCSNNVIFFNRHLKLGEKIFLKVIKMDPAHASSFLLGMTTCGLAKIENIPGHLVEFCKPFFKCGGYSIHNHVNYANSVGDIVEIERLKIDGSLRVRTNGRQSGIRDMTDGARFKTAKAVPFINLNLGVSSIQILHQDPSESSGNHQMKQQHRMDAVTHTTNVSSNVMNESGSKEGIPVTNPVIQSVRQSAANSLELSQSLCFNNVQQLSNPSRGFCGDSIINSAIIPPSKPPPGFGPKSDTVGGVPFSKYNFGFDIRTPSPALSSESSCVSAQTTRKEMLERRPTFSQLFHQPEVPKDDPKAIRRPSTDQLGSKVISPTVHNNREETSGGNDDLHRSKIKVMEKVLKPRRTTNYAGLCDIQLVTSDPVGYDDHSHHHNGVEGVDPIISSQFESRMKRNSPSKSNNLVGNSCKDTKVVMVEKWLTSGLVLKRDIFTVERNEEPIKHTGLDGEGRFYAFLKQPLEPNTRCTFKIRKLVDMNRVKDITGSLELTHTITFGLTNVKMSESRGEVDMLPTNPMDLINRSYEEWFISTNFVSNPFAGMVFHIERNRDGEIFVCTESVPTTKDWFIVDEDDLKYKERKAIFNVFYCSEYHLFFSLHGIISSIELLAVTKLSEEYNNNLAAVVSLNGALSCVNLAAAKCIRCKGAEVEWAPDDCSHRSYCQSCARSLARKRSTCLVCGSTVSSVSRIFI